MANVSKKKGSESGLAQLSPTKRTGWGILSGLMAVLTFISLIDYDPSNYHVFPQAGDAPMLGQVGIVIARYAYAIFGLSAWFLPWFMGVCSWIFLTPTNSNFKFKKLVPFPFIVISVSVMANLRDYDSLLMDQKPLLDSLMFEQGSGGIIGAWLYSGLPLWGPPEVIHGGLLRIWVGEVGTWMIAVIMLTGSLVFHFSLGINKLRRFHILVLSVSLAIKRYLIFNRIKPDAEDETISPEKVSKISSFKSLFSSPKSTLTDDPLFGDVSRNESEFNGKIFPSQEGLSKEKAISPKEKLPYKPLEEKTEPIVPPAPNRNSDEVVPEVALDDGFKVVRAEKTEKATNLFPERKGDYHFPTLDLLMEPPEVSSGGDEDHMIKAKRLKETLSEFKIDVELGEVHTGPVITRYDIHPAAGVRVEKIANLDKNLAMALRAESVRILAPVPGKGCVGVEVPNDMAAPVCLKEILESRAWADANAEIPIVLGKEASGKPLVADLTKMPHLLVAGSTGSGKTVCINAIIASLCYHSSPDDVRFIMVDPKIVEMKVYNDLPHMLIPVVTEPKKVPGALKWLLVEMERRYQIFSKLGVRNIAGFNAKILKDKQEKEKAQLLDAEMTAEERAALSSIQVPRDDDALEIPENKLPYIVCIIDELADLMMVAQADVETGIARLAQLARAAGIHLIIATQRPSVNVITGVIKANLPSRISFRVASYRDSQTILDGKGAESLIGKGDMLFIPPGSATFMRAQGAFVSDDEINGIVDYLKINGPPQIIEEVREQIESAGEEDVLGSGGDTEDEDPMLRKAVEIIRTTKRASTSNLQRKLSIGYNRAARIMDELEERGIVGPDLPGQGREILMDM